jgi:hypothetical protein
MIQWHAVIGVLYVLSPRPPLLTHSFFATVLRLCHTISQSVIVRTTTYSSSFLTLLLSAVKKNKRITRTYETKEKTLHTAPQRTMLG